MHSVSPRDVCGAAGQALPPFWAPTLLCHLLFLILCHTDSEHRIVSPGVNVQRQPLTCRGPMGTVTLWAREECGGPEQSQGPCWNRGTGHCTRPRGEAQGVPRPVQTLRDRKGQRFTRAPAGCLASGRVCAALGLAPSASEARGLEPGGQGLHPGCTASDNSLALLCLGPLSF